jgi:predicted P-loop ATPase
VTIDTRALLERVDLAALIASRVPLKRVGHEWVGLCPFHDDKSPSFHVVPAKRFYHCFSCGATGDAIDWIEHFEGVGFREAAERLGALDVGALTPAEPTAAERAHLEPRVTKAPPANAGQPDMESRRWGRPKATWEYRGGDGELLFYVARYEYLEDGVLKKVTPQWTWGSRDGRVWGWGMGHFNKPRPLYGLDRLAQRPDSPILLVEGEKSAEAAQALLPRYVVLTWPGGAQAVKHAVFSILEGRDVVLWPDADRPGIEAMRQIARILDGVAQRVRMIHPPATSAPGWDAADALAEGWDQAKTIAWCREHIGDPLRAYAPVDLVAPAPTARELEAKIVLEPKIAAPAISAEAPKSEQPAITAEARVDPAGSVDDLSANLPLETWDQLRLILTGKGLPLENIDNVVRVLDLHPLLKGKWWLDTFHQRIFTDWRGEPPRELSDAELLHLTLWMQRTLGLRKLSTSTVDAAVQVVASRDKRSAPAAWLRSLTWDGTYRISSLFTRYFNSKDTGYTQAAATNFLTSMVARVLHPGCKADAMLILEGPQGAGKSSALQVLGGEWYAEATETVLSKDFFVALQGKWLVEIGELDAFNRAETTRVKQVITATADRYRAPYGRHAQDYPRQCCFVGTTNDDEYLRDPTGARRFWPVRVTDIDRDGLAEVREQLFAEAVMRFDEGHAWWEMPTIDTLEAQRARRAVDEWESLIARWAVENVKLEAGREIWFPREEALTELTVGDVLGRLLRIEEGRWTRADQMRVAHALRSLGWRRTRRSDGRWVYRSSDFAAQPSLGLNGNGAEP